MLNYWLHVPLEEYKILSSISENSSNDTERKMKREHDRDRGTRQEFEASQVHKFMRNNFLNMKL